MDKNEKNVVTTVFDYLRWRGDLTFAQDAFNEVDNLVLCIITYLNFRRFPELRSREPENAVLLGDIVPRMTAEDEQQGLSPNDYIPLMKLAAESRRFGGVRMLGYETVRDEEREMQLDALSFLVPDGTLFCAFMGTDRSLVGWKENLNLSFMDAVPAQVGAAAYVEDMAGRCPDLPLRIGGHSKGGNLAAYAALHIPEELQQRLLAAYNNDGPGFTKYMMGDPGYLEVVPRIHTLVPQSSVIGMLLEHEEPYTIIKSNQVSVLQHDPYSWEVMGPNFVPMQSITADSQFVNQTIKAWIASMDTQERNRLVDALFGLLGTGGIDKALDIFHPRNIRTYIKTLGNDPETRQILSAEFQNLMEAAKRTRMQPGDAKTLPDGK